MRNIRPPKEFAFRSLPATILPRRNRWRQGRDTVKVNLGGYLDKYAGNPVPIEGKVEFLGKYGRFDQTAVLLFGDNNRVIIKPTLHQVTTPDIFDALGINIEELDIISLKSRVHFRRGFHETGLAGTIIEVDAHINDDEFARIAFEQLLEVMGEAK